MTNNAAGQNSASDKLSAYGAAKLANVALKEAGLPTIPPQMMYNYTTAKLRAGKKPLIKYTEADGVDRADFERWLKAYIAKKTVTVTAS